MLHAMASSETRDQLLDAAVRVLAERGLHGFTMRAVSTEADCALGLVNYHFEDKDALVVETYQRIVDQLMDASAAAVATAEGPDEKLIAFIETVFGEAFLNADYLTLRLSLWAAAGSEPSVAALNMRFDRNYLDQLAELLRKARPALTEAEAEDRATDIMVAQNGIWLSWVVRPDEAALERCLVHCRALALGNAS